METPLQTYSERAQHCEQMAFRLRDPEAKTRFVKLARQWRLLAERGDENWQFDHALTARR